LEAVAADVFLEIIDPETTPERRRELRDALTTYCAHDTMALVRVARKFVSADS